MRKFISDVLFNALYQVLLIILPVITMPILSRRLGADGLGAYSYVFSIAQFLMIIISVGMNPFRIRRIAQTKRKLSSLNDEFWNIFFMQLCIGGVVTLLYTIVVFMMNSEYKELYLIQIIFLVGITFDIAWFFQGIEEFAQVVIRNTLIKLLSVVLIILTVKSDADLPLYVLITSATNIVGSLIFWFNLRKHVQLPVFSWKIFKSLWRPGMIILLPQVFMQVYTTLDKTIVGSLTTNVELSYYDQSQKIARILLALLSSLTIVMLPKMTDAVASGEKHKVFTYTKKAFEYTLLLSLVMFTIVFVNTKEFIVWFFSAEFAPMTINMLLVTVIIIVNPIGGIFSNQFALAMEKDKEYAIPLIVGSVVSLVGNYILVPLYQSLGATIVLITVEVIVCVLRIVLVRKFIDLRLLFTSKIVAQIFITILITGVGLMLPNLINNLFFNMMYKSIVIVILFVGALILTKADVITDLKSIIKRN